MSEATTLKVLAFGIAKEIVGGSEAAVPFEQMTVSGLVQRLKERYPALGRLSSFMIAVNGKYAGGDTVIHAGDEVAIIPPVSGG